MVVTPSEISQFNTDGFLLLKGFYSVKDDIAPIRTAAARIIGYVSEKCGFQVDARSADHSMSAAYTRLHNACPDQAREIYDAVKQIPEFVALTAQPRNIELYRHLRPGSDPAIAYGGSGIRIDRPGDEEYKAPWHQEFPSQLRSMDGIVFWSPLVRVSDELGPVELVIGSHKGGCVPVRRESEGRGAYGLRLADEEAAIGDRPVAAPSTQPGDLLVMDFLTIHRSGVNRGAMPRWSMQFRLFNLLDPIGRKIGWSGSYAAGVDFSTAMPQLLVGHQ